ncbi:MAG: efflux transporter outer membrane subunit [Gammaproteobacteria bacterium]|nr:efflux transporter outer membrane subunit [Gammaproteobacteria bacterium]
MHMIRNNQITQWLKRRRQVVVTASSIVWLSACAVGPDFERPASPQVQQYTATGTQTTLNAGKDEPVQYLTPGKDISAKWWTLYRSPQLTQVVDEAIVHNQTLAAARATLAQVQQTLFQTQGGYYPQLDLNANAQRQGTSSSSKSGTASTYTLYSAGANVSYRFDLFGTTRRQVEQAAALLENQGYQLAAAYLTLTGNTVTQAINIASIHQQIKAVQDIIADDEHNLQLVKLKFEAGKAAQRDVLVAESQLANDRVALPPLKQQLSVAQHALAVAIGKLPGTWTAPAFDMNEFTLPTALPLSVPSELVRQRPDILAAEAKLHADSAAIGIATSQLYPSITLSGSLGSESLTTSGLFRASSGFWSVVAGLTAPLFHGGQLQAQKQAAIYTFQASAADYQQTVLTAFGQVADVLRALNHDAELVGAQKTAMDTSQASLKLQRLSYEAGKSDLLQLLDAERAYQQARLGYVRALAQRYQDTAQLFVAMGGGWWQVNNLSGMEERATSTSTSVSMP